jgi:predicted AlkP superfamily pyrophosphatase or phosphodiesterase
MPVRPGDGRPLRVEPWVDKDVLVQAPTLYDVAHAAGLTTAQVDWVAIQNAKTITWAFPERPTGTGKVEQEMIREGLVTEAEIGTFIKAPIVWRDEIWTRAGTHIIEKHRPNLLMFHLLTTDSTQHRYGANSLGGNTALALADAKVGRLLESARRAGILDQTTVFVVADHGFKTYKSVAHPNALLRKLELVQGSDSAIECDAWVIPEGGSAMVYITRQNRKAELTDKLKRELAALGGVAQVISPSEYDKLGYPQPSKNDRMADLVLAAKDGYAFDGAHTGETVTDVPAGSTPGTHGYISTDPDMNAAFVAWGAGIKAGAKLDAMRTIDLAPTMAHLLSLKLDNPDGRVLNGILR